MILRIIPGRAINAYQLKQSSKQSRGFSAAPFMLKLPFHGRPCAKARKLAMEFPSA
jgi:hypothetical protein